MELHFLRLPGKEALIISAEIRKLEDKGSVRIVTDKGTVHGTPVPETKDGSMHPVSNLRLLNA